MSFHFTQKKLTDSEKATQNKIIAMIHYLRQNHYIKGYGKQDRLMTFDHSPVQNMEKSLTSLLKHNGFIKLDGMTYTATDKVHSFDTRNSTQLKTLILAI